MRAFFFLLLFVFLHIKCVLMNCPPGGGSKGFCEEEEELRWAPRLWTIVGLPLLLSLFFPSFLFLLLFLFKPIFCLNIILTFG